MDLSLEPGRLRRPEELYQDAMLIWEALRSDDKDTAEDDDEKQLAMAQVVHLLVHAAEGKHAKSMFKLAFICSEGIGYKSRNLDEAEMWSRAAVERMRQDLDASQALVDKDLLVAIGFHAVVLNDLGRNEDAIPLFREALSGLRMAMPAGHSLLLGAMESLATALFQAYGLDEEGEALRREAMRGWRDGRGPKDETYLESVHKLACGLAQAERCADGEPLFREALAGLTDTLGGTHERALAAARDLSGCLGRRATLAFLSPRDRSSGCGGDSFRSAARLWTESANLLVDRVGKSETDSSVQKLRHQAAEATALAALVEAMPLRRQAVLETAIATVQEIAKHRTQKMQLLASEDEADLIFTDDSIFVRITSPTREGSSVQDSDEPWNALSRGVEQQRSVDYEDREMAVFVNILVEAQAALEEIEQEKAVAAAEANEEAEEKRRHEEEKRRHERIIAQFARRFADQLAYKALNTWQSWVEETVSTRNLCRHVFNRLLSIKKVCAFEHWVTLVDQEKAREDEKERKRKAKEAKAAALRVAEEARRNLEEAILEKERKGLVCANCGVPRARKNSRLQRGRTSRGAELTPCGRCGAAFYCSRTCRVLHWKASHQGRCKAPWDIPATANPTSPVARSASPTTRMTTRASTPPPASRFSSSSSSSSALRSLSSSLAAGESPRSPTGLSPTKGKKQHAGRWSDAKRETFIAGVVPGTPPSCW